MLEEKRIDETTSNLSRRDFLVKAGALTAGMAVAGGLLGTMAADSDAAMLTTTIPYAKLDPEHCRQWGLEGYKGVATDWTGASILGGAGCCFGAAYGILKELWLTNAADSDWRKIDPLWFNFGGGGIGSWGTLCGALNASLYVVSLAINGKSAANVDTSSKMGPAANELMTWYCRMPFPSPALIDGTLKSGKDGNKVVGYPLHSPLDVRQVTSISGSPLCHASVSTWIKAVNDKGLDCSLTKSGVQAAVVNGTDEKSDRCARITGDTAAKAAVILNNLLAGTFNGIGKHTLDTNFCLDCHNGSGITSNYTSVATSNKNNEQGLMPCIECHDHEAAHTVQMDNNCDCKACHSF